MQVPLCVSGFVTVTVTAPAACPVVVPVTLVALIVETVSAEPPKATVAPAAQRHPATRHDGPAARGQPPAGPLVGASELTVGAGARYVKQPVHVPLCVSVLVTTTFTDPAACAVVVPVMLVAAIVATVRAEPPNDTFAPAPKPLPAT